MTDKNNFDTVCWIGFTFIHETEKPDCYDNVSLIRQAIINKVASLTDDEILGEIDFGETIETDL